MENKTLKFKTNLNCENCVSKVKNALDQAQGIDQWSVDTLHPDKILTVNTIGISIEEIIKLVRTKGFKIEHLEA